MDRAARRRQPIDWGWCLSTALTVNIWLGFASLHLSRWLTLHEPVGLGLMLQETIVIAVYITRRRPRGTSGSWFAWFAAGLGTYGMLVAAPTYHPVARAEFLYMPLQFVGVCAAAVGITALGRSFGLVAANRGVKTGGPYRLVRHPIYAGYMITYVGYLLENPSFRNVAVIAIAAAFQVVRIAKEEEYLRLDPDYIAYSRRVHFRLLPYVY